MSDICLILEGTYPFVSGGVSTWIHQLVTAMSDVRFSVVHISPFPNPRREYKYKLPSNVVNIQDLYLHERIADPGLSPRRWRRQAIARLEALQEELFAGRMEAFTEMLPLLRGAGPVLSFSDLFRSPEAWEVLTRAYERHGEGVSFLDFFWTWRSIYLPLLKTLQCPIPKARLYHTVSTGYAGVLAAVARRTMDSGMLLTEHGVYTHERLLEISQSTWIYSPQRERFRVQRELSFFKRFWLGFFDVMGRLTYQSADRILTLYDGNRTKQILAGAPPEKIAIIPNGIDLPHYRDIPLKPQGSERKTVAFIGRVVPIKDVKTFIHAARIVSSKRPGTEFLVVGPTDEEPDYTAECRELVKALGVTDVVRFLGKVEMRKHYPDIDLVVLTSLSEAQPYVILEANAIGLPVVATDVGACREMLEGRAPEDKEIGPSGLLTGVSAPEDTAHAVLRLLSEPGLWNAMSEAGRARTSRFYDQDDLISRYLNLYEHMMR
ncbi:MAG: GT4 family glycosyltransferase PelF [Elusimicrobia bacterium]|nr:GT4 family glycosyltransferase PelF [Elusimicrobiota bacterium]